MTRGTPDENEFQSILDNNQGSHTFVLDSPDQKFALLRGQQDFRARPPNWITIHLDAADSSDSHYPKLAIHGAITSISDALAALIESSNLNRVLLRLDRFPVSVLGIVLSIPPAALVTTIIAGFTSPHLDIQMMIDRAKALYSEYYPLGFLPWLAPAWVLTAILVLKQLFSGGKSMEMYKQATEIKLHLERQIEYFESVEVVKSLGTIIMNLWHEREKKVKTRVDKLLGPCTIEALLRGEKELAKLLRRWVESGRRTIILEVVGLEDVSSTRAMKSFLNFISKIMVPGIHLLTVASESVLRVFSEKAIHNKFNYGNVGEPGFRKIHFLSNNGQ